MHSLSEPLDLTCGQCGRTLAFELWLIVDAGERPDLLARVRAGDLHTVSCPTCGPQGEVDAPLLLYLPDHNPATGQPLLIFSPAEQTSAEQDQQMAAGLLRELAGRLGAAWQDGWLAQVASVRRDLLPVALSDDPAAALRERLTQRRGDAEERREEEENGEEVPAGVAGVAAVLTEIAATLAAEGVTLNSPADLERALAERPDLAAQLEEALRTALAGEDEAGDDKMPAANLPGSSKASGKVDDDDTASNTLADLLERFVGLDTWDEAQHMVEANPALLSDAADALFAFAIAQAQAGQNAGAVEHFTMMRGLLRRCREAGIARAFAERMLPPEGLAEAERLGMTPEEYLAEMHAVQDRMPPALREVLETLAAEGVEVRSPEELERALAERPDLAAQLEEALRTALAGEDEAGDDEMPAANLPGSSKASGKVDDDATASATLPDLLNRFIAAESWDELQRIVEAHPELLSEEADTHLVAMLSEYAGNPDAVTALTEHRTLLRRCREVGVARAFAEKMLPPEALTEAECMGLTPEEFLAQMRGAAQQMPPALREVLAELAAAGVEIRSPEELERALASCPDLRAKLEAAMAEDNEETPNPPEFVDDLRAAQEGEQRYRRTGDLDALDAAAAAWARILDAPGFMTADPRFRLAVLNGAGGVFLRRFWARGRGDDLDRALAMWGEAVGATPAGSPDLPMYLNNLGTGLSTRFGRTGRLEDLEEAIRVSREAVGATPAGSPDLPSRLNNLGTGLRTRFGRTGRLEDLEEAIRVSREAVGATPAGSPDLPSRLNNLGTGLRTRFGRTGRLEDLEEAIRVSREAVGATPAGSPDLPMYLNNLGNGLSTRFGRTGRMEDLEEAIRCYRWACGQGAVVAPQEALTTARNWGRWALRRAGWEEVEEAYLQGLTAGRALWRRQVRRADKENWLADMQEMAPAAAYAIVRGGGSPLRGAHILELGRAQLLGEALEQNRRDLDQLPAHGHALLYARYQAVLIERRRLEDPAATLPGDRLAAIVAADREFDAVIADIRRVPGYADFLADPTREQILAAAQDGPLVYLLATAAGGLALIVHGEESHKPSFSEKLGLSEKLGFSANPVEAVWLDGLTEARLREWLVGPADDSALGGWLGAYQTWLNSRTAAARDHWHTVIDVTLRALWDAALAPVAAALANLQSPNLQSPITLIPSGLLALLPLHAAWTNDAAALPDALRTRRRAAASRTYFLDCFDVAYAPSATARRHAQTLAAQMAATAAAALLAIDEPHVAGAGPLPNSAAEVTAIAEHFAAPQVLRREAATRDAVLAALPGAAVAHFSCHGNTHWQDALQSGLLLADGARLTVGDLLDKRLPGARLITLSACETGIVGTKLLDETVALPAALTQAGFAGVAASLWSVYDISTAMLMVRFYELWRTEGLAPPAALCAAQRWVRDTTNAEKLAHFGRDFLPGGAKMFAAVAEPFFEAVFQAGDGAARTFEHPVWWAAFTYTGV